VVEVGATIIGVIHILGMAIWIGGAIFMLWVLAPAAATALEPPLAGALNNAMGPKWTPIIWGAMILTIVTGILRTVVLGGFDPAILFESTYGTLLLAKIALVIIAVILGVMTTSSGIKTGKLATSGAAPPVVGAQAAKTMQIAKINLVIGVVIVTLAVGLRVVGIE